MAGAPRYTTEQVIKAIRQSKGLVTKAAERLHCEPNTVRNYAKRYSGVAEALQEERERMTDVAEMALYDAIKGGEGWAVCFYLKTQGRSRGYVERVDVSVLIEQAALKVAKEFDMTANDVIEEAQLFMLEERYAR